MIEAVRNAARNIASYAITGGRRFGTWMDAYEGRWWEVVGVIYLGMSYLWSSNNGIGAMIGMVLVFFGMLHVKIEMVEEGLDRFTNTSGDER